VAHAASAHVCARPWGPATSHPGLQPERTALAWRRTLLALAVGAIVALRLLNPALWMWSIVTGLIGLALAAVLGALAARRARHIHCRTSAD
jgi:uncharacterized membrane protein YidH (DUF202 family)